MTIPKALDRAVADVYIVVPSDVTPRLPLNPELLLAAAAAAAAATAVALKISMCLNIEISTFEVKIYLHNNQALCGEVQRD